MQTFAVVAFYVILESFPRFALALSSYSSYSLKQKPYPHVYKYYPTNQSTTLYNSKFELLAARVRNYKVPAIFKVCEHTEFQFNQFKCSS